MAKFQVSNTEINVEVEAMIEAIKNLKGDLSGRQQMFIAKLWTIIMKGMVSNPLREFRVADLYTGVMAGGQPSEIHENAIVPEGMDSIHRAMFPYVADVAGRVAAAAALGVDASVPGVLYTELSGIFHIHVLP